MARQGKTGKKWHIDSTEIKIQGRTCYIYRCIDKIRNLIEVYLSDTKNKMRQKRFSISAETKLA